MAAVTPRDTLSSNPPNHLSQLSVKAFAHGQEVHSQCWTSSAAFIETAAVTAGQSASPPPHPPTHLPQPQSELVAVEQELRLAEPLRSELLGVAAVVQAVVPGGGHAVEQAVCMVKAPALQLPAQARERLHAYEVEQGGACRAQVAAVELPSQANTS